MSNTNTNSDDCRVRASHLPIDCNVLYHIWLQIYSPLLLSYVPQYYLWLINFCDHFMQTIYRIVWTTVLNNRPIEPIDNSLTVTDYHWLHWLPDSKYYFQALLYSSLLYSTNRSTLSNWVELPTLVVKVVFTERYNKPGCGTVSRGHAFNSHPNIQLTHVLFRLKKVHLDRGS